MKKIAAIILAAGKGKRMKAKETNKVVLPLGNKQMILHVVDRLTRLLINPIIVVVGFAKESVMKVLEGRVIFAEQKKRLGTAHAVIRALDKIPQDVQTVLVLYGDDSAFYTEDIIKKITEVHWKENAALSFLTITVDNPSGLGRVVRDSSGKAIGIVEEKDADQKQRKINEINAACYVFNVDFLRKNLKRIEKSRVTGEYYLPNLIGIAIKEREKVEALQAGTIPWRGINTPQELQDAQRLFLSQKGASWK